MSTHSELFYGELTKIIIQVYHSVLSKGIDLIEYLQNMFLLRIDTKIIFRILLISCYAYLTFSSI